MKHLKPWQAPIFQLFPLLLICLALSWLPPTLSEIYQRFKDCAPINYTCGNLTVPVAYPFRIDGRHDYCGYKEYFLICSNNHTLTINIGDRLYQVKDIDYMNQMLKIADPSSINGTCPLPLGSTTLDLTLYEYSERDLNLTFFFNCTPLASNSVLHDVGCNSSIIGHRSYYMIDGHGDPLDLPRMCRSTMIVSVDQAAISMLESNTSSFGDVLLGGFSAKWIAGNGWCSNCSLSGGLCGHNADSPSDHTCICSYGLEIGTCSSGSNSSRKKIAIGVSTGLVGFLFISLMLFIYLHNRKKYQHSTIFPKRKANNAQSIEAFLEKYGSLAPRRYTYSDVRKMTKSFAVKLGQGGFGTVFKGNLISGHPVAVKVLIESKGDGEEFVNEVASIGKTSHVNIVSLLGFCLEGTKRALIYDFMPNGSLDKYIYTDKSKVEIPLGWEKLYNIAQGVAYGLEYLHRGCNTRIVHLDIKPHNILLDGEFCPKISDFGLAKLCLEKNSKISMVGTRGTIGYIAPEVFSRNFGVVSSKSDVYSYGMMLLEMVGGRKNIDAKAENTSQIYYPHWIYEHLNHEGDLEAWEETEETEEIARKMILVGLWCIQTLPGDRPSMSKVVDMLEGCSKDLQMPPKPYLSSPVRSTHDCSTVSIS